mmetsp:Transcript_119753/g.350189  ORF Transcript_119753/g.350189 Transcript_119753/m.350189 type:complete len:239 (-) Transcript_119753:280-996(-)
MLELSLTQPTHVECVGEAQGVKLRLFARVSLQVLRLWQKGQAAAGLQRTGRHGAAHRSGSLKTTAESRARAKGGEGALASGKEGPGLLREHRYGDDAAVGQHRKAAVAQLLHLHVVLTLLVLGVQQADAKVTRRAVCLPLHHVDDGQEAEELRIAKPAQHLRHVAKLHHGIMGVDGRHLEGLTRHAHAQVRGDPADRGKHGDAPVLQLRLTEPADIDGQGEAHWVEPILLARISLESR